MIQRELADGVQSFSALSNQTFLALSTVLQHFIFSNNGITQDFLLGIFVCINIFIDYAFRLVVISILRKMRKEGKNLKHVLIVGYSRTAENYIRRLRLHPEWGYKIHGILDDNKKIGHEYRTVKVVDRLNSLEKYLSSNEFDEIGHHS